MTAQTKSLNPTDGHIIAGTPIDPYRFIGRVRAAQLFQIAPDPRDTENKKKIDASHELQGLRGIREEVQRLFEGAKRRNVEPYAEYIVALKSGQDGLTPPITLFSEAPLAVEAREDGTGFIQVPWDKRLVAIDGETQLAARHEAANLDPETKHEFVSVSINHGRDEGWARQAFHDLNTLGVRPNAALSLGMDARDPITHICREVERRVPFFRNRVNKVRRQLRTSDAEVVTITTLRGACVTLAKGINGVQFGARPVPLEKELMPAVEASAIEWFTALTDNFRPAFENRDQSLASSPTAMAALGAIGHPLVQMADPRDRALKVHELVRGLTAVNWTRDKTWEGIAGKFTPKGAFSLGGSKETAYAVYAALSDPTSAGYARVRGGHAIKAA
jgi:DGQHR domain-containing protein